MPDLDLSALRKVAEAAKAANEDQSVERMLRDGATFNGTFDPPTVLALLDELETLRARIEDAPHEDLCPEGFVSASNPTPLKCACWKSGQVSEG